MSWNQLFMDLWLTHNTEFGLKSERCTPYINLEL